MLNDPLSNVLSTILNSEKIGRESSFGGSSGSVYEIRSHRRRRDSVVSRERKEIVSELYDQNGAWILLFIISRARASVG